MKRSRLLRVLCIAAILTVSTGVAQAETQSPSDEPNPAVSAEPGPVEKPPVLEDQEVVDVNQVVGTLIDLADEYSDAAAPMTIDYENGAILQRYRPTGAHAKEFAAAATAASKDQVRVTLEAVDYTQADLVKAVDQLTDSPDLAIRTLGAVPLDAGFTDRGLYFTLPATQSTKARTAAKVDVPTPTTVLGLPAQVTIASEPPIGMEVDFQSSP